VEKSVDIIEDTVEKSVDIIEDTVHGITVQDVMYVSVGS
jgi:hypothetical protein